MTTSCPDREAREDLQAYLHDALSNAERERFERHLLGCAGCQAAVEDALQLLAAGAELARQANPPRAVAPQAAATDRAHPQIPRRRRPVARWVAFAGVPASVMVLVFLVFWPRGAPPVEGRVEGALASALAPHRLLVERLPYGPLDRYRPYDTQRGARASELIPFGLVAEIEAHRRPAALVAVLLATGDLDRAEAEIGRAVRAGHASHANQEDDDLEIDRAVLAIARKQHAEALRYLDGVLARSPGNGLALWNRARVLDELRLPGAAAEDFAAVAKLGEAGWSSEAAQHTSELEARLRDQAQRWQAGKAACDHLPDQRPDRALVRVNASVCRTAFYEAVRIAPSRDAVLALLPIAEVLDETAGNAAATSLVRQVTTVDPARRQASVAAYVRLTKAPDLPVEEKRRLLDQLRASNQNDLVLGAIRRTELPGWRDEYVARARASNDPFYLEVSEERIADQLLAAGDPLGAEVVLRRAVRACEKREAELRCSYLYRALANIYEVMHRPSDERAVAQAGLERSRRLGLYWDERLYFDYLAEAARADGMHELMRAYLREATLRSQGECEEARHAQETLAMASIDELRFAQARRELTLSPACDGGPTQAGALAIAELARFDGTAGEAAALRAGLVHAREAEGQTAGQQAYLDAIEGRLVAARDPGAARPLLQRAIEAADRAGRLDMDGVKARADAYASLLVVSASEGDHGKTLDLFTKAAGTPPGGPCAVGVMVDAERVLVVARDRTGKIAQHFDPRGRKEPALDAASLIPAPLVRALSACERIDVLALPPVFGLPNLLPPELAWSYRGRSFASPVPPAAPPSRAPHVVTVADAVPPSELDLAPLRALALTPIPGASHVDLRGAEATPARVLGSLASADAVEIHAHGFLDLKRSDASLIALSPQADGHFTLSARDIADLQLPRAPLVILAACHAAYTAPYRHEPWGLPHAFLLAGARAVIASPETISDAEAGGFFRAVEQHILAGTDPAIALRDERARQLARDPSSWTRAVLLFD